ncbi:MAG: hypothetical protein Q9164_001637 [Protoblastenia rupestris]
MTTKGSRKPPGIDSSLKNLSISSSKPPKTTKSTAPPESWEEEAITPTGTSSSVSTTPSAPSTPLADLTPGAPPPTPISPTHRRDKSTDWSSFPTSAPSRDPYRETSSSTQADKRPEKSSATAGRMIAGALGVKSPKLTEEQKLYEKAVRDKERKRIEGEREDVRRREREKEEARKAVWDE